MKWSVIALATLVACSFAGIARAQSTGIGFNPDHLDVDFMGAATLGHKSSSSYGGEVDYTLSDDWQLFAEVGDLRNVATSNFDARAQTIASFIGGSASTAQKAIYFDAGGKYRFLVYANRWQPFVQLGVGAARVTNQANFLVGGTDVTSQLTSVYGVQVGNDLSGSLVKFLLTVGGGLDVAFGGRFVGNVSYRYGYIFARPGQIANDIGIKTQRVQVGIGVRF